MNLNVFEERKKIAALGLAHGAHIINTTILKKRKK
jgi:hypothetical protein